MSVSKESSLTSKTVVLSLINGMIGGIILLLPILSLKSGYLLSTIMIVIAGFFSYYSCNLCILHIGNQPDLDKALYKHFNNSIIIKKFYDLSIFLSLIAIDILYFQLIILQWIGLVPPYYFTNINAILNAILIFGLTIFMKYYSFGTKLMAYGIISIISYIIFLSWVFIDQQKSSTRDIKYTAFGQNGIQLFASMGMGFSIQTFFIPILKKYKNINSYQRLLKIAYIVGGSAYLFIALVGSYGILYRSPIDYNDDIRTIQAYFGIGTWQVNIIELIYLIHLYSVFPQFLLISKYYPFYHRKRLFNVLNITQNISIYQIIYITIFISICLVISILRISIRQIIDINGALLGFIFIYLIPISMHIKCMYINNNKIPLKQMKQNQKYQIMIEQGQPQGQQINKKTQIQLKQHIQQRDIGQQARQTYQCGCNKDNYSSRQKIVDFMVIISMFCVGGYILVDTLIQLL